MFHYWSLPTVLKACESAPIQCFTIKSWWFTLIHHRCMRVLICIDDRTIPWYSIHRVFFGWPVSKPTEIAGTGFDPSQRIPMGIWGPRRQSGCQHVVSTLPQNEPTHPIFLSQKGEGKKHGHLDHESIIYDLSWTRQFCGLPKLTV